ncbi:hypothetical protein [Streptomyces sp. NPDC047042]|uniref:hypothetical protein n=1 Tax=Streptomyces sp. NPDC047042 TaxID=3154807 RepID=UPI0034017279
MGRPGGDEGVVNVHLPPGCIEWVLSCAAAARQVKDTPLLEAEVVLDKEDSSSGVEGDNPHRVLHYDVLVRTGASVRRTSSRPRETNRPSCNTSVDVRIHPTGAQPRR